MSYVQISSIRKTYGNFEALRGVDIDIARREFVVLLGPSGCGKSTLLRMIAGLERINGGDLVIDGARMNEVKASQRGISMVFQSYALYPHKSVRQNMEFGLKVAGLLRAERQRKIAEAAEILQLTPPENSPADSASGSRSGGPSCVSRRCFCSTNRFPTSTRDYASRCAWSWRACTANSRPR
jgi:multiple sugar transport system ATP-binding protein